MRYVLNNPKNFYGNGSWFAFFVCGLKILGAFYAELICLWKMGQQDNIEDIVKDFIAFGIIAEIDGVVARGIRGLDAEEVILHNPIMFNAD